MSCACAHEFVNRKNHFFYSKVFEIHHNALINSCFLLWFWFEFWHEKNTWPRGFMGTFFFKNWNMHSIEVIVFGLKPQIFLCWDSSLVIYFPWLTSLFFMISRDYLFGCGWYVFFDIWLTYCFMYASIL